MHEAMLGRQAKLFPVVARALYSACALLTVSSIQALDQADNAQMMRRKRQRPDCVEAFVSPQAVGEG